MCNVVLLNNFFKFTKLGLVIMDETTFGYLLTNDEFKLYFWKNDLK